MTSGRIKIKNLNTTDHNFTLTLSVKDVESNETSPWSEYIKLNKDNIRFYCQRNDDFYTLYCSVEAEACDIDNDTQDNYKKHPKKKKFKKSKRDKLLISVKCNKWEAQRYITSYNTDEKILIVDDDDINCNNDTLNFLITASVPQSYGPFKTMYADETLVDFKLAVKESGEATGDNSVGFHRTVLAAWSPVMMKMFSDSWKEKNEGVLALPVKLEVIKALKKYVYTEELPEDKETLLGLAELGSYFMNPKLEISASKSIIKLISPGEIWETILYSGAKKTNKLSKFLLMKVRKAKTQEFDQVLDEIDKL